MCITRPSRIVKERITDEAMSFAAHASMASRFHISLLAWDGDLSLIRPDIYQLS